MKTISIAQILDDALSESGWKDFCIYVFRDGDFVLYVGKTKQNIIGRLEEHLGLTYRDQTQVGRLIVENAPLSRSWSVDLLTLEDCLPFVREFFPDSMGLDLEHAERATILKHSPPLEWTIQSSSACITSKVHHQARRKNQNCNQKAIQ